MGKLVYSMLTSLDGFVNDAAGQFDWATPDEELHRFINDVSRGLGTTLVGRRMYETMVFWERAEESQDLPPVLAEYAEIWQGYDKVVYSTTLMEVGTARTRTVRAFDAEAVCDFKAQSALDISIDGPTLAAHALRAGLVDEVAIYVCPVVVGGGTPFYPPGVAVQLELLEERRFGNGVVYLRYNVVPGQEPGTSRE